MQDKGFLNQMMSIGRKIKTALSLFRVKALEMVRFDSSTLSTLLFVYYHMLITIFRYTKRRKLEFAYLGNVFRHIPTEAARSYANRNLTRWLDSQEKDQFVREIDSLRHISISETIRLAETVRSMQRPFDSRLIILAPPRGDTRGVLLVKFTENFKYIRQVFNIDRLQEKYLLIFEPSFAGYFDHDVLTLLSLKEPSLIEASEPVDFDFIRSLRQGLTPIDLGANNWVDPRTFHELNGQEKDFDIVMPATWADFKRHHFLFSCIKKAQLREKLRVALVGVPWGGTLQNIESQAQFYGVQNQIKVFEGISQYELNNIFNRSKATLILSKKEGVNKAIIESMHANTPAFLLQGFNYGHNYSYMNEMTGGFIQPAMLPDFLDSVVSSWNTENWSPRKWVLQNMSAIVSTRRLRDYIVEYSLTNRVAVNSEIVVRVNNPDCDYMESENWDRFEAQYSKLTDYLQVA